MAENSLASRAEAVSNNLYMDRSNANEDFPMLNHSRRISRPGFSVVELLVVVFIIGILIALSFAVGTRVLEAGKASTTKDILSSLDQALGAYTAEHDGKFPPATVSLQQTGSNEFNLWPVADAMGDGAMLNSAGMALKQLKSVPAAEEIIKKIPAKFLSNTIGNPALQTVVDAWGNPIRYVHPTFEGLIVDNQNSAVGNPTAYRDLAQILGPATADKPYKIRQIRRNGSESDSGLCPNSRPYFYSSGSDGNAATTEDNIYVTRPEKVAAKNQ